MASHPLIEAVLESMPVAVLALDGELRIRAANATARALGEDLIGGFGDAVRCVNASINPAGCGHSQACEDCVVLNSAQAALAGKVVRQRETQVLEVGGAVDRVFLISAGPFLQADAGSDIRVLLVVEEVTELHRMRGLVPICANCKSIRRDDEAWERLEGFIQSHSHVMFTHSLCPDCVAKLYPDL